jgi:hypothetical protein
MSLHESPDLAAPESLALRNRLRLSNTESQGHPLLRAEVARLYRPLPPHDIPIAVPEEAILMQSLIEPGDRAPVVTPACQSLHQTALGRKWRLDPDQLERGPTRRTRLPVVNFPHNPTGFMPSHQEFDTPIRIARQRGFYLLGDQMHRFLKHDPAHRPPAVRDAYENGSSLAGPSKSSGLPGLRRESNQVSVRDVTVSGRQLPGGNGGAQRQVAGPEAVLGQPCDAIRQLHSLTRRDRRGCELRVRRHPHKPGLCPWAGGETVPLARGAGATGAFTSGRYGFTVRPRPRASVPARSAARVWRWRNREAASRHPLVPRPSNRRPGRRHPECRA